MCRKSTQKLSMETYFKTKAGVITMLYNNQKGTSKRRNHNPPSYNKEELKNWLYTQNKFHFLYDKWKKAKFQKELKPSIDRKDDSIGYTMDNIQLMTWRENNTKSHKDMRSGKIKDRGFLNGGHKPVIQYSLSGQLVSEFISVSKASRVTLISKSNISNCCHGNIKVAGGYLWSFKI